MLDGLKGNLRSAIKKIVKSSGIDKELIDQLAKDVQIALFHSDVNVNMVLKITTNLKERAYNETPPPGLPRKDHIVKILYEELANLLGNESEFSFVSGRANKVVMLGIQGSGKTTATAKLARFLTSQGYKVGVIGADTYRPGALVQLKTMCERTNVEVYGEDGKDSPNIVKNGLKYFATMDLDVIIIDTAGRHKEESDLLDEMKQINHVAQPDLALLVIDGTIGQQCFSQAEAFHKTMPVGGIVITKLDSSAKGGGAIAASAATGAQIMYIGTGERIDDLEKFSPTRFVGKLLGMGDIQAVLNMAKRLEEEADGDRLRRITTGKMNIEDFFYQLEDMSKVSSLQGMLDSIPGLAGKVKKNQIEQMEEKIERWRYIIQSMTAVEKANPDLLNQSRVQRIARGSGRTQHDVKDMIKQYNTSKTVMKSSRSRNMQGMLRRMGLG